VGHIFVGCIPDEKPVGKASKEGASSFRHSRLDEIDIVKMMVAPQGV
jgi:hypothetical protein